MAIVSDWCSTDLAETWQRHKPKVMFLVFCVFCKIRSWTCHTGLWHFVIRCNASLDFKINVSLCYRLSCFLFCCLQILNQLSQVQVFSYRFFFICIEILYMDGNQWLISYHYRYRRSINKLALRNTVKGYLNYNALINRFAILAETNI